MKEIHSLLVAVIVSLLLPIVTVAQTDPAPQALPYSQNFSALAHASPTYPTGWQGWEITGPLAGSFILAAPALDLLMIPSATAVNAADGCYNFDGKIGMYSTTGGDVSTLVSAYNTTANFNIRVKFSISTIRNPYDGGVNTIRQAVELQYRVGIAGPFTSIPGGLYETPNDSVYRNNNTTQIIGTIALFEKNYSVLLPPACENQPIVQLRWVVRSESGSGSDPSFALDNISVASPNPAVPFFQAIGLNNNFTALGFGSTTVPTGYKIIQLPGVPGATFKTSTIVRDTTMIASSDATNTNAGGHNYNGKFGFLNGATADLGIATAISTINKNNVTISYDISTIRNPYDGLNQRILEVELQYRVSQDTGVFISVPAASYLLPNDTLYKTNVANQTTAVTTPQQEKTFVVVLPDACNNQPYVQLRWVTRTVSGAGNMPSIALDNIVIEGKATAQTSSASFANYIGTAVDVNWTNGNGERRLVFISENTPVTFGPTDNVTYAGANADITLATPYGGANFLVFSNTGNTVTVTNLNPASVYYVSIYEHNSENIGVPVRILEKYTVPPSVQSVTGVRISRIQGKKHISPFGGQIVTVIGGVVTALDGPNAFYMQDPTGDGNDTTSEGLFVSAVGHGLTVNQSVIVYGSIQETRQTGDGVGLINLTVTTLNAVGIDLLGPVAPVAFSTIGTGGRVIPTTNISTPAPNGDVEDPTYSLNPIGNSLDFFESLEGMRVTVPTPVVVGPTRNNIVTVVTNYGNNASIRSIRGGLVPIITDANPERIFVSDSILNGGALAPVPNYEVRDTLPSISGIVDYNSGKFFVYTTMLAPRMPVTPITSQLKADTLSIAIDTNHIHIGQITLENFDGINIPTNNAVAQKVIFNMKAPDIIAVHNIADNSGSLNDGIVGANTSTGALITALSNYGIDYGFAQVNPVNNADGGALGSNLRTVLLYRLDRIGFTGTPGGSNISNAVQNLAGKPNLQFNPGRIAPTSPILTGSRKPFAGQFTFKGRTLFVLTHWFDKDLANETKFGRLQPARDSIAQRRSQQALLVQSFVQSILSVFSSSNVIVLSNFNEAPFAQSVTNAKGTNLFNLTDTLAIAARYTTVVNGNSYAADQILASSNLVTQAFKLVNVQHFSAEYDQPTASMNDGIVSRFEMLSSYNITGSVLYNGNPKSGVKIKLTGGSVDSMVTGVNGTFSFTNLDAVKSYTVTPTLAGFGFNNAPRVVPSLESNTIVNFIATESPADLRGKVTLNSLPFTEVMVYVIGTSGNQTINDSTLSDSNGDYAFTGLPGLGSYTAQAKRTGYDFVPGSHTIDTLSKYPSSTRYNFNSILTQYTISGKVVNSEGAGIPNIRVTISGGFSNFINTDATGNYSFGVEAFGNYMVTAFGVGYSFTPQDYSYTNVLQSISNQNFVGSIQTYSISGNVTLNGTPDANVTLRLTGSVTTNTTTDVNGTYTFVNLPAFGNYTVKPEKASRLFNPSEWNTNAFYENAIANFQAFDITSVNESTTPKGGSPLQVTVEPNPASERTVLSFEMVSDGAVRIDIFDANGTLVSRVADGFYSVGSHSVQPIVKSLSNGTYYVRIIHPQGSITTPLVIVR